MSGSVREQVVAARDRLTRAELDVDALRAEVARLHHRVAVLEGRNGLAAPRGPADLGQQVVALRRAGLSLRAIAARLGTTRNIVAHQLEALNEPTPEVVTATDGRRYAARRQESMSR